MVADLDLDPDGLRRVARAAARIADALDAADPGPCPGTLWPEDAQVEQARERLRESVRRARDELVALATDARAAAARAEEADRVTALSFHALSRNATGRR